MRLLSLSLQNFRNIEEASLDFGPGPQILVGKNAQGKTSLLEAVYFLATATSHRTRRNRELIRKGTDTAFIRAEFETANGAHTLSAGIDETTRRFRFDGDQLARSGDLYGRLRAVFFSPEDLEIVTGGPGARRRLLDLGLCQKHPEMVRTLLDYRHALKQRNAVLKSGGNGREMKATLAAWSPELASLAAKVVRARGVYALELLAQAGIHYASLTESQEKLTGEYRCTATKEHWKKLDDVHDEKTIESVFLNALEKNLDRDLTIRSTTTGPHRDDLHLEVANISATRYASQGQRRSLALSIKLAERDLLTEGEEPPILLIDDVTHEMDAGRCQRFLEVVTGSGQALLTFTEIGGHRHGLDGADKWTVDGGKFSKDVLRGNEFPR
jgi:DNA replication and repair protein RecF